MLPTHTLADASATMPHHGQGKGWILNNGVADADRPAQLGQAGQQVQRVRAGPSRRGHVEPGSP